MPATITINGVTYSGNSVSVRSKRVIVDGQDVTVDDATRITIEVHGNIETLQCDNCDTAMIHGEVGSVTTASGNVQCSDVRGSVRTASGNVNCGDIGGEVRTASGNMSRR
ncbi:Phage protein [Candidatus Paraburkholderia calva]|nr:Phage protein [Candidatus Paraburkholderia calva]